MRNGSLRVILPQGLNQFVVQSYSTQKLCVGFDSIEASVGDRNEGGDHLVLSAGEREVRGHESAESGEGMQQSGWNQAVRRDDARHLIVHGHYGRFIFLRI